MSEPPIRIAMWSGPRNISTAMMRAFENRADTGVIDEPFYAAYLAGTGIDHPLREQTLAACPSDWREVVRIVLGSAPGGEAIFYQKHMTHHLLPEFGRDWADACRNAFLIRAPEEVLTSYVEKRETVALSDIGFVQQHALFEHEAQRLGRAPPVVEASDVLADPRGVLGALCEALGIGFSERMLSWPAGRRAGDGVWAPAWYDAVERSTGFARPSPRERPPLRDDLKRMADIARPYYERLVAHKLTAAPSFSGRGWKQ
ncbi:MAG TPA: hypothetical protein VII49_08010 [Rhizomicrobium sp.]